MGRHSNTQLAPGLDFNRAVSMQAASDKSWNNRPCSEHWQCAQQHVNNQRKDHKVEQRDCTSAVRVDRVVWIIPRPEGTRSKGPVHKHLSRIHVNAICSTWAARVLTDLHTLPFRQLHCQNSESLQRNVCKMPTRKVDMLKSICWIGKALLDCSGASVSVANNCQDDILPRAMSTTNHFDDHCWRQSGPARTNLIQFPAHWRRGCSW